MTHVTRQEYYDALFSHENFKGVTYDADTHKITIGDGPIFDKMWKQFCEDDLRRMIEGVGGTVEPKGVRS